MERELTVRGVFRTGLQGRDERIDFAASRLSGGRKRRVVIARALMKRPDLIIADEPTGNLDRASADRGLDLMREAKRRDGATFLICTHDDGVAARYGRRLTQSDGKLAPNIHDGSLGGPA